MRCDDEEATECKLETSSIVMISVEVKLWDKEDTVERVEYQLDVYAEKKNTMCDEESVVVKAELSFKGKKSEVRRHASRSARRTVDRDWDKLFACCSE
jgi:hypothetical protein